MGTYIKNILDMLKTSEPSFLNKWCNERYKKNKDFMLKNGEYCTLVKDTVNYPKGTIFKANDGKFLITIPKEAIKISEKYGNLTPEEIIIHDAIMEKLKKTPHPQELISMAKIIGMPNNMIEMTTMPRDKIKTMYDNLNGQFINGQRPQEYMDIRNSDKTDWFPSLNEYLMFFMFRPNQSSISTFGMPTLDFKFWCILLLIIAAVVGYFIYSKKKQTNFYRQIAAFGRKIKSIKRN